ncbi:MAG: hypothetical protein JWP37_1310 [Mucilaginibacter sp.]|nr:hypothetical protein [Mucilaginibacter sp.]
MILLTTEQKIYYVLRIAAAMCFIGHGAFGIITKQIWCNYFAVFGIGHDMAYQLMPLLGTVDILMGIIILIYPIRAVVAWLIIWGTITALLRPLSGEPFAELIERAGNFGAPLALLLLLDWRGKNVKRWFTKINPDIDIDGAALSSITTYLRVIVFLLLIGHGWLNLIEKKGLLIQYTSLGFSNPGSTAHIVGLLEILAACIVLIRPARSLLLIFLIWKMVSELFYPHYEIFEWVERGGSYGTLIALWFALKSNAITNSAMNMSRPANKLKFIR